MELLVFTPRFWLKRSCTNNNLKNDNKYGIKEQMQRIINYNLKGGSKYNRRSKIKIERK